MATKSKHSLRLLVLAVAVLILGVSATFVIIEAQSSHSNLEILGTVPQFQLTERSGAAFGSKDMQGKINVVDFIFTSCQGPCPVMADNMSSLYKSFGGSNEVQLISISVDPTRDRLAVLQEYARKQGVTDNRWVFLRGDIDTIKWLSEGVFKLAADDLPAMHSTKFILVDDKGQIRGYYSGTDKASINVLKTHIRELVQDKT
jgi:protein SCO1/2